MCLFTTTALHKNIRLTTVAAKKYADRKETKKAANMIPNLFKPNKNMATGVLAAGIIATSQPASAHPIANEMSMQMAMTPEVAHTVTYHMCAPE